LGRHTDPKRRRNGQGVEPGAVITPRFDLCDSTDSADMLDSTDANDAHEPTENAEHAEPIEPIDANEPIDPIENDDPVDAIEQNELCDQSEKPVRRNAGTSAQCSRERPEPGQRGAGVPLGTSARSVRYRSFRHPVPMPTISS
jgi:hypothetical protein